MFEPARIGIVGLGRMGARLVQSAQNSGHSVVAALDASPEPFALGENPALAGVLKRTAEDFWAVPMDLLLISTTAPSHVPLLRQGLAAGIRRFVVEKPFCTGLAEGRAAVEQAEALGARVIVNHGRRYCPNYGRIAAMDGTEAMGSLRAISVSMGAGGLGCMGVHYLDLFMRLFGGKPTRVLAVGTGSPPSNPRGGDFDDPGACAILEWPGQRRAVIELADDTGIPPILEFRFSLGRVVIESEAAPWRVMSRKPDERALPLTRYGQPLREEAMSDFRPFGIMDMAAAAIAEALGEGPTVSGTGPALDAIEVFAAIRHAVESGQPVSLPLSADVGNRTFAIP